MPSSSNGYWRPIAAAAGTALGILLTIYFTLVRNVASEEHVEKAVAPVAERSASNSDRIGAAERDLSGVQQQLRDVERRLGSLEGKVDDIPEKVVRAIRGGTP